MGLRGTESADGERRSPRMRSPSRSERSPAWHRNSEQPSTCKLSPKRERSRSPIPYSPVREKPSSHTRSPQRWKSVAIRQKSSSWTRSSKCALSKSPPPLSPTKEKNRNRSPKQEKSMSPLSQLPESGKLSKRARSPKHVQSKSPESCSPSPQTKRLKRVKAERDDEKGILRDHEKNRVRKGDGATKGQRDPDVNMPIERRDRAEKDAVDNESSILRRERLSSPSDNHYRNRLRSGSPLASDNRARDESKSPPGPPPLLPTKERDQIRSPKQEKSMSPLSRLPELGKPSNRARSPQHVQSKSPESCSPSPRTKRLKRVKAERDDEKGIERDHEKNRVRKGDGPTKGERVSDVNLPIDRRDRAEKVAVDKKSPILRRECLSSSSDHHYRNRPRSGSPQASDNRARDEVTNSRVAEQRIGYALDYRLRDYLSKVTSYCNFTSFVTVMKGLDDEHVAILHRSFLWKLYPLRFMQFSGQIVDALLLRLLKPVDGDSLYFSLGDGKVARFSIFEFALITGLNCKNEEAARSRIMRNKRLLNKYFGGRSTITPLQLEDAFKSCSHMLDKLKLGLVFILESVLRCKHHKTSIDLFSLDVVDDIDSFNDYPWGWRCFLDTLHVFRKVHSIPRSLKTERKYNAYGLPLALQIWAYEAIPALGSKWATRKETCCPRMHHWQATDKPNAKNLSVLLDDPQLEVYTELTASNEEENQKYVHELSISPTQDDPFPDFLSNGDRERQPVGQRSPPPRRSPSSRGSRPPRHSPHRSHVPSHEFAQQRYYSNDLFEHLSRHLSEVIRDEIGVLRHELRALDKKVERLDENVKEIMSYKYNCNT